MMAERKGRPAFRGYGMRAAQPAGAGGTDLCPDGSKTGAFQKKPALRGTKTG